CLHGNLLAALIHFDALDDARVQRAVEWQTSSITGSDAEFRYYRSGTSGPGFKCGSNRGLPCAWGANKALRALLAIPSDRRSDEVRAALRVGAEFLLSSNPALADYPYSNRVSDYWHRLSLPISYWSDVLETLENLTDLGYGADPRLDAAFALVLDKRDDSGRWLMESSINGRTWTSIERRGEPSKWVTLRAMTTLRRAGRLAAT
ncbi:MAG TPA: nitrogen fixation protein NifH, partial [Dehalococcoidia bacterium]|nr:nitrogen fixation protein NifH [Dehalococcoidia bacterium]